MSLEKEELNIIKIKNMNFSLEWIDKCLIESELRCIN